MKLKLETYETDVVSFWKLIIPLLLILIPSLIFI